MDAGASKWRRDSDDLPLNSGWNCRPFGDGLVFEDVRPSILCALGALLVLPCGCSGDTFTSATPAAGAGGATSNAGGSSGAGGQTAGSGGGGASAGSGGALPGGGGSPVGTGGAASSTGGVSGFGGGTVGAEAGVVEAGAATTWCATQRALFCEDFDRYASVTDLENSWGSYSVIGGQFSLLTGGSVPSRPNALHVATTVTSNVKTLVAKTLAPLAVSPSKLHLEFALRIDKAENIGYLAGAAFAAILNGTEVSDGGVAVAIGQALAGGSNVLEVAYVEPLADGGTNVNAKAASGPFPQLGQWGRYALDIQYSTGASGRSGCARLLAAGVDLLASCMPVPASLSNPKTITVVLGVYSAGLFSNSGTVELGFDNVALTAQ